MTDGQVEDLAQSPVLQGRFARTVTFLAQVRSLALTTAVTAIFVFVSAAIVINVSGGTYLIEPITVPRDVATDVPDKDGVAAQLRDAVGRLSKLARDNVAVRPVQVDANEPKISITGTSFSVREIATFVREHTGWAYPIIGGELLAVQRPSNNDSISSRVGSGQPRFRLTLRLNDGVTGPFFDGIGEYGDVMLRAAIAALHEIDPVNAAAALSTMDHEHRLTADAWIDDVLSSKYDDWKRRTLPRWLVPDASRALLVKANVSLSLEKYDLALEGFEEADLEYRAHHGRDWGSAKDGQATAYLLRAGTEWRTRGREATQIERYRADVRKAEELVRESLSLEPASGSAMYHLAQIADVEARNWFEAAQTYHEAAGCDGFSKRKLADERYASLTSRHPDFAIAYDKQATMIMEELLWLRANRITPCGVASGTTEAFETELWDWD